MIKNILKNKIIIMKKSLKNDNKNLEKKLYIMKL